MRENISQKRQSVNSDYFELKINVNANQQCVRANDSAKRIARYINQKLGQCEHVQLHITERARVKTWSIFYAGTERCSL